MASSTLECRRGSRGSFGSVEEDSHCATAVALQKLSLAGGLEKKLSSYRMLEVVH
jgi:hypothetical protein